MPEARQEYSLVNGQNQEPRTPEPSPRPLKNGHDLPTIKRAHQSQPLKMLSSGRSPKDNTIDNTQESRYNDLMNLGLMLPVLEEAEADIKKRSDYALQPFRFSPSAAYTRFGHQTLPSMRQFHAGSPDPRSVIPRNPQDDDDNPSSLCFPDMEDEEQDTNIFSMRLLPKRRRREKDV